MFTDRKRTLSDNNSKIPSYWMVVIYVFLGSGILWITAAIVIYSAIPDILDAPAPTLPPSPFLGRKDCIDGFSACLLSGVGIPDHLWGTEATQYPSPTPTITEPTPPPSMYPTNAPNIPTPYPTNIPTNYPTFNNQ